LSPLLDAEGRVRLILGISRDITEQEKEKREANQLEKEIDYRKDFVMTAAHELRTPLQPILGYLHLLLDDPEYFSLTAETGKMLRTCLDNVERERHIVDRMLELSLLYAEKISINPTDVALKPLVLDIVRMGEYDHHAEIAMDIPEGVHLVADRDCLYTVLECLISNAIRFNNPPRHVGIRYQMDGSFHAISVEDDGIGISPSALQAIFEPFHLADAEKLSRPYNRIGLALSIARKYINLHGGTIDVESTVGEGSTFTVRIPPEVPYGL
jgi:signal transduction histidine kinase